MHQRIFAVVISLILPFVPAFSSADTPRRVPVIDVTDLYHPYQDPGDNFDLIAAFALPEVDLRAVILDCHQPYRQPVARNPGTGLWEDPNGPREAGFIPVLQLNYLFGRSVPCAAGPFGRMRSPEDDMRDVPRFEQQGVELLLKALRESREKVHIASFGSARPVAVAFNRDPALFRRKVARVHLSAGSSDPAFLEWNVALDPHAIRRLLESDLPVAIYPCGTRDGAFAMDRHNTYWQIPSLRFVRRMDPRLQRYIDFAFRRIQRSDFLRAMDLDLPREETDPLYVKPHHVWETAIWMEIAGRVLAKRKDGSYSMLPKSEISEDDRVIGQRLVPCAITVPTDGRFSMSWGTTGRNSRLLAYERETPEEYQRGLAEALPALYISFRAEGAKP